MFQHFHQINARIPPDIKKRIFLLLLLMALGCIGALPIAPRLLAASVGQASPQTVTHNKKIYTDGQCTTSESHIVYQPAVKDFRVVRPLPDAWTQAGRGEQDQDYVNALSCAAAFIETYETFDYHQIQTLYTAISLLSAAAQQRFYEGDGSISASIRTDPSWQNKIKQNQIIQVASVSLPTLFSSEYNQHALYLTLTVPYQVIEQIYGQTLSQNNHATVLLKGVPSDLSPNGTGWQVVDWRENE